MKKIILIIVTLVLLLVGAGATWAYVEFLYTKPLTKAELGELTPDWDRTTGGNWSPWFVQADGTTVWNPAASYNAWLATVPEEDKAWPLMVKVFYEHYETVFQADAYLDYANTLPHHRERWERFRAFLETDSVAALTAGLEEAVSRPVLGCPLLNSTDPYEHAALLEHGFEDDRWVPIPPKNQPMIDVQLPWLGRLRAATHILQGRAALALENGDPDTFVRLIEDIEATGDLNADLPIMIGQLVEIAIDAVNQKTIGWALRSHPELLDEVHLQRLSDVLRRQSEMEFRWTGDQLTFHDAVRRMADGRGAITAQRFANGQILSGEPVSLPLAQLQPSAQRMLLVQQNMLERGALLSEIPWNQDLATAESLLQNQRTELNALANSVLDILIPAYDKAVARVRVFRQQAMGLRVAIAAHRHRLRHGAFSDSLEAFDDDLLTINPIDAFTGEPLQYKLTDTGPLIYSVGDDRVDDGGMIRWDSKEVGELGDEKQIRVATWPDWFSADEAQSRLKTNPESIRGDWVLFPKPVNDPEPIEDEESDN